MTSDWKEQCEQISKDEFWDAMEFAPIKRMGFSDGPGAVFHGEPYNLRLCKVTHEKTETRSAHFVLKNADGEPEFFRVIEPITLAEFKALCEVVIPGIGPCEPGAYGADL